MSTILMYKMEVPN